LHDSLAHQVAFHFDVVLRSFPTNCTNELDRVGRARTGDDQWLRRDRTMDANEKKTFPGLGNTEISSIKNLWENDVLPIERQVRGNLLPDTHLVHSRDIFDEEGFGEDTPDDPNEITV